jgi:hypothetical protein
MYHSRDIIPVKLDKAGPRPMALLALVNSRLMSWWHGLRSPKAKKALFPKVLVSDLKRMPIARAVLASSDHEADVDRLCALSQRMCDLVAAEARIPQEEAATARETSSTDRAIDRLVYDLYVLTEDEIALVESSFEGA